MLDIKSVIAKRLRQCRTEQGWTGEETAKKLNVGPSRYSNWEQGLRKPKDDQIFDLAELFNKPAAWIAGLTDFAGPAIGAQQFIAPNQPTISVNGKTITLDKLANNAAISIDYIKRRQLNENRLSCIFAPDDSMAPLIKEGDEMLIDRTQTDVKKADLFAIWVNGQVWIRWIRPEINGDFTITAEDTDHYPDNKITKNEIAELFIIGRVARVSRNR